MPRGPVTPKEISVKTVEILHSLDDACAQDKGERPTAKIVREELRKFLKEHDALHLWPGLRKIQDIITKARSLDKPLAKPLDVDDEWSLAVLAKPQHGIPVEATDTLLDLWKLCRILGRKFSIREARWASWLRGVAERQALLFYAVRCASRARACEALGLPLDLNDLAAPLVFKSPLEPYTARDTQTAQFVLLPDEVRYKVIHEERRERAPVPSWIDSAGQAIETLCNWRDQDEFGFNADGWRHVNDVYSRLNGANLTPEGDAVYAMWLRTISHTEVWNKETAEEHVATMLELRQLIGDWLAKRTSPWGGPWKPDKVLVRYGLGKSEKGGKP